MRQRRLTKYVLLLMLVCVAIDSIAQPKWDYTWVIASRSDTIPGADGIKISFHGGEVSFTEFSPDNTIALNNAMICDDEGELLLFTNGCEIFDGDGSILVNGDGINPGPLHENGCDIGTYPGPQNGIFLPDPGSPYYYYYLHKDIELDGQDVRSYNQRYSYIRLHDIAGNAVEKKNIKIDSLRDRLISFTDAILHANGTDWWIIDYTTKESGGDRLVYALNSDSIFLSREEPYEAQESIANQCSAGGQTCFAPNGTLYALYCPYTGIDIFDFDRETATFSNYRHLSTDLDKEFSGLAFSPNSRFIYVSAFTELYQLDLWEENLEDGFVKVGEYDYGGYPFHTPFTWMQLAPDCKIYITSQNSSFSYHVINAPNKKGVACDFVQRGLELPVYQNPGSIPNVPLFRFGDDFCDPAVSTDTEESPVAQESITIYPNPSAGDIVLDFPRLLSGSAEVKSADGRTVSRLTFSHTDSITLTLSAVEAGLYFVEVIDDSGIRYVDKVLKVE